MLKIHNRLKPEIAVAATGAIDSASALEVGALTVTAAD